MPLTGAVLTVSAGACAAGASRNPATMPLDALPAIAVPSSGSLRRAVAAVACRSSFRACPYRRAVCCPHKLPTRNRVASNLASQRTIESREAQRVPRPCAAICSAAARPCRGLVGGELRLRAKPLGQLRRTRLVHRRARRHFYGLSSAGRRLRGRVHVSTTFQLYHGGTVGEWINLIFPPLSRCPKENVRSHLGDDFSMRSQIRSQLT